MPPSFRKARRTLSRLRPFGKRPRGAGPDGPDRASAVASAGGDRNVPISPVGVAGKTNSDDRVERVVGTVIETIGCVEPVKSDGVDKQPAFIASGEKADGAVTISGQSEGRNPEEEKREIGPFDRDEGPEGACDEGLESERGDGIEGEREGVASRYQDHAERGYGRREEVVSKTRTFASIATTVDDATLATTVDDANEEGHGALFCGEVTLDDLRVGAVDVLDWRVYKRDLVGECVFACADPMDREDLAMILPSSTMVASPTMDTEGGPELMACTSILFRSLRSE